MAKNSYPKVVAKATGKTSGGNSAARKVTKPSKVGKKNPAGKVKPSR